MLNKWVFRQFLSTTRDVLLFMQQTPATNGNMLGNVQKFLSVRYCILPSAVWCGAVHTFSHTLSILQNQKCLLVTCQNDNHSPRLIIHNHLPGLSDHDFRIDYWWNAETTIIQWFTRTCDVWCMWFIGKLVPISYQRSECSNTVLCNFRIGEDIPIPDSLGKKLHL